MAYAQGDNEGSNSLSSESAPSPSEFNSIYGATSSTDNGTSAADAAAEGRDRDYLFNPSLPKCAAIGGKWPEGFNQNGDEQCVPQGGCPEGYHWVEDDETGTCYPKQGLS